MFENHASDDALSLTQALSRWEREGHSQSHNTTDRRCSRTTIESTPPVRLLSPLPAGEGKGEGEL